MLSQSRTTERLRGARHGKNEAQKEHFAAHNARRRCLKKKFEGIHDRFQRDSTYGDSQLKIGWTEEKCIEMDNLAQENHSFCPILCGVREILEKLVHLTEQIRQKCTDEIPIRLPRSTDKNAPSSHVNLEESDLNQFLSINTKVGIRRPLHPVPSSQYLMVAVE